MHATQVMTIVGAALLLGCPPADNRAEGSSTPPATWILANGQFRNPKTMRLVPVPDSLPVGVSPLQDLDGPDGAESYSFIVLDRDTVGVYVWTTSGRLERLRILSSDVETPRGGRIGLTVEQLGERVGPLEALATEEGVIVWGTSDLEFSFVIDVTRAPSEGVEAFGAPSDQPFTPSDSVRMILWARSLAARNAE